jgi:hypothetical protein
MPKIISFEDHKLREKNANPPMVITRFVDGEAVEYVNFDALTPTERLLLTAEEDVPQHLRCGNMSGFKPPT